MPLFYDLFKRLCSVVHPCRPCTHAGRAPMQIVHPCKSCTHAGRAPMQAVHTCTPCTHTGRAPMQAVHLCRPCTHAADLVYILKKTPGKAEISVALGRAPMHTVHPCRPCTHASRATMQDARSMYNTIIKKWMMPPSPALALVCANSCVRRAIHVLTLVYVNSCINSCVMHASIHA